MCGFAMYDIPHVNIVGYDVVSNRPKVAAYRAPGAPNLDLRRRKLLRRTGARTRDRSAAAARDQRRERRHQGGARADLGQYRLLADARGGAEPPAHAQPLGPNQGRGIASGFWFNIGGEFERRGAHQRGRHRERRRGQPRYRRLARLDGDDGGRGARHPVRAGAPDRRRYRLDRLLLPDRRQPRHLRDRHGGDAGGREGRRRTQEARRDDLGHQPRRGRLEGRQGLSGRPQRRQLRAAVAGRHRAEGRPHRRADHRRGVAQRAGRRARLCDPYLRRRGRPRDRPRQGPALYRDPGCRPGDPPVLCRGADPGRRDPGHRLGAQRGIHLRQERPAR